MRAKFELVHSGGRFHVFRVTDGRRDGGLCSCRKEADALDVVRRDVVVILRREIDVKLEPLRSRLDSLKSVEIYGLGINAIRAREDHARKIANAAAELRFAVRIPTEAEISQRMRLVLTRGFASRANRAPQ